MDDNLEKKFSELIQLVSDYSQSSDLSALKTAFEFAKSAHFGEKRLTGIDFINHPLETALILASWKMDNETIVAGLLHDTIEHGAATKSDILNNVGPVILSLIEGVTSVSKVQIKGKEDEVFVENLRKMFLAMAKDLRIVFIKLAERVDNLKTLGYLPEDRRKNYAIDSLEIYGVLAERLGMWDAKKQIDNNAFEYAYPDQYEKVKRISFQYYKDWEKTSQRVKREILKGLKKENIDALVITRKKDLYSLYSKLKRPEINWDITNVHDIIALRIIVKTVKDCYLSLGLVHSLFKPVPHLEVGDFIAHPKPNGYRSIHTRVFGREGKIVEIQIRTEEMDEEAQNGAAAHWQMNLLKKSGKITSVAIDEGKWKVPDKLKWVKELSDWQKEIKDSAEFLKAVKFDALAKRIFALSPEGDAYDLPINATPVDYAYAVHTGLGKYIVGAKADGRIVSLNYLIQNGEVIEIIKSKNPRTVSSNWLDFVVTTVARREIKKQLREKGE